MRRTDALIVGGGPAGAAAAITLARAKRDVLLVERKARPEGIVCGGFLSWDTLAALRRLGIDPDTLGARPIRRVRLIRGNRVIEADLPHPAAGLSRVTLDTALLDRAQASGAELRRATVNRIEGTIAHLADGGRIEAAALFAATGKHAVRGIARDHPGEGAVGLRATIAGSADLHGLIELHLFDGGYAGLLIQEDGRANLCLSIAARRLRAAGSPEALLAALVRESPRLADRLADRGPWSSIAAVPYGWRATTTEPGAFRVGDQAAVIASLVGDGIGIALESGRSAADALLAGQAAPDWQHGFARHARRPIAIAEALRRNAESPRRAAAVLPWLGRFPALIGIAARLTRIGH